MILQGNQKPEEIRKSKVRPLQVEVEQVEQLKSAVEEVLWVALLQAMGTLTDSDESVRVGPGNKKMNHTSMGRNSSSHLPRLDLRGAWDA